MNPRFIVASLAGALSLSAFAAEPSRFTEKCNTQAVNAIWLTVASSSRADFVAAAMDPQHDADTAHRLWEPDEVHTFVIDDDLLLKYDPRQDIAQIVAEVAADPVLRAKGVTGASMDSWTCFSPMPLPVPVTLTEYHNAVLDHYFLSSSAQENAAIDSGAAGAGWSKTGETLNTVPASPCYGSTTVHRFYGPLAHSHVFTPDPQECGNVRKPGTGWQYEGVAFGAFAATNGECQMDQKKVWRLYNNRAAQGDSNHRYVAKQSLIDEMTRRGWTLEGVAFCVNP